MRIEKIQTDKKQYLELLLLADEAESMIDRYLERGEMYALFDDDLKSVCVVTEEGDGIYEIKNIATWPQYRQKGYGKTLVDYIVSLYASKASVIQVGTGDVPKILQFYKRCGFTDSHRLPGFFTDHYPEAIYEDGIQLIDMIYLKKTF